MHYAEEMRRVVAGLEGELDGVMESIGRVLTGLEETDGEDEARMVESTEL